MRLTPKFVTPFKSSQGYPDDGFDDSELWYPDGFSTSQASSLAADPTVAAPKPPATTSNPQQPRICQKSCASITSNKPEQSNVKTTQKRKFSDTALPPMPRTPKTPTKVSRIIPPRKDRGKGSKPRTPTRKKGTATFAVPRTPTFEMYGIKQMLSQKSTPGISPGKILRKLRHKTGGGGQPHGAGSERREVENSNLPLQVNVPSLTGKHPPPIEHRHPVPVTDSSNPRPPAEVHTSPQPGAAASAPENRAMIYNFQLSPGGLRRHVSREARGKREEKIKRDVLRVISRMAEDLHHLRERRQRLRTRTPRADKILAECAHLDADIGSSLDEEE